jgi:hypothetical protein
MLRMEVMEKMSKVVADHVNYFMESFWVDSFLFWVIAQIHLFSDLTYLYISIMWAYPHREQRNSC